MSQHIEIEFKNLLTQDEFLKLASFMQCSDIDFHSQVNHYFDTETFSLKAKGCALRIREKHAAFELTLKQPAPTGLLETNQSITADEKEAMIESGKVPIGPVQSALSTLADEKEATKPFFYFGSLTTRRAEKVYKNGLIVLDHSRYLNTEDFEIEYEVQEEKTGYENFKKLLMEMGIPIRKTDNKIMRFYRQKQLEADY